MSTLNETVLVTVAPFESVTVSPHPSGIPGLAPLVLRGGDTLRVSPPEAERLYDLRKVVGLKTGEVKPNDPPSSRPLGPSISFNNGPLIPLSDGARVAGASMMAARESAEKINAGEEARRVARNAERQGGPQDVRRATVRLFGEEFGLDPLGPLPGITAKEGGWE
ncbi:MAG: hypothetical protein JWR10_2453 [Rubritepida sp.]|nr:hypothetical protein [Rubritepida sp.]